MIKIIVTGGSGFIGTNLILELLKDKKISVVNLDKISACSNFYLNQKEKRNRRYYFKKLNLCKFNSVKKFLIKNKPDIIFHLAAETHVDNSLSNPIKCFENNLMGTVNLLTACNELLKIKKIKFIHVGTDEIYGDLPLRSLLNKNENSKLIPNNPYSSSKAAGVLAVETWIRNFKFPAIICNSVNNFGPFQFVEKFIPRSILNSLKFNKIEVYGKGLNIRSWLYVKDHVYALIKLSKKGKIGETYSISAKNNFNNFEIAKKIKIILKKKNIVSNIKFIPDRLGHDLRYSLNNNKIKKIGWKPKHNFKRSFQKTVEWYLKKENTSFFKKVNKNIIRKGISK